MDGRFVIICMLLGLLFLMAMGAVAAAIMGHADFEALAGMFSSVVVLAAALIGFEMARGRGGGE